MRLTKLLQAIEGRIIYQGDYEREISALTVDSRNKVDGSLFFCLSGGEIDSHNFALQAITSGAVALVTEKELSVAVPQILVKNSRETLGMLSSVFYDNPSHRLSVVGITGTNGKTTTSYMLQSIFEEAGKKTGVIGTLGIRYNGKEYPSSLTTPDPIELQKILAEMLRSGVEYVFMEVSAHALHYEKTIGVRFCACIFTNLSQDHLDFFKDMERYRQAKEKLFSSVPIAVLNADEEEGRRICVLRQKEGLKSIFYGITTPADAFAIVTDENLRGSQCMLNINDKLCRITLSLIGLHNVYNALGAATCAAELGISSNVIARGLGKLKGVNGRLQRVTSHRGGEVFIDFAHTPDGLANVLDSLKKHCKGRLLCLFGCGGNRDRGKRPIMGEIVAKKSDFSVLTSDNPRYEDPLDIISEIERGYRRFSARYVIVPDRGRAIEYALAFMRKDDVLLIAGKGGENYQEIMGIKYPFNDQAMVEKLLKQKEKSGL